MHSYTHIHNTHTYIDIYVLMYCTHTYTPRVLYTLKCFSMSFCNMAY